MDRIIVVYSSPIVEIITISVERGFEGSGNEDGGISAPDWGII